MKKIAHLFITCLCLFMVLFLHQCTKEEKQTKKGTIETEKVKAYQKIIIRMISMLLIVSDTKADEGMEMFNYAKRISKNLASINLKTEDILKEFNSMGEISANGLTEKWMNQFKIVVKEYSDTFLTKEGKLNTLKIGITFSLFDKKIDKGEQLIMAAVGESLGLTPEEFSAALNELTN